MRKRQGDIPFFHIPLKPHCKPLKKKIVEERWTPGYLYVVQPEHPLGDTQFGLRVSLGNMGWPNPEWYPGLRFGQPSKIILWQTKKKKGWVGSVIRQLSHFFWDKLCIWSDKVQQSSGKSVIKFLSIKSGPCPHNWKSWFGLSCTKLAIFSHSVPLLYTFEQDFSLWT